MGSAGFTAGDVERGDLGGGGVAGKSLTSDLNLAPQYKHSSPSVSLIFLQLGQIFISFLVASGGLKHIVIFSELLIDYKNQ
ncbi:MAG: hypothetical protein JW908_14355 [Anaerolineales bacterium]|nr:hypothetical protein [Anaerolineales bacterium]